MQAARQAMWHEMDIDCNLLNDIVKGTIIDNGNLDAAGKIIRNVREVIYCWGPPACFSKRTKGKNRYTAAECRAGAYAETVFAYEENKDEGR